MVLSHVDVEGKQLVFTLRGIGVCKPWQQALTVVQIVFFGVNDDKLINTKLINKALNKQIDGILLGSSLGCCCCFFFITTELKNDIVRKMLDSGFINEKFCGRYFEDMLLMDKPNESDMFYGQQIWRWHDPFPGHFSEKNIHWHL